MSEILDRAALDNLLQTVGGDKAFLAEMIDTYLDDAPQLIAAMRRALETNDAGKFRNAAHALKSNSANFGARTLARMSKELEELGKADALKGAAVRLAQIEIEFEQIARALRAVK